MSSTLKGWIGIALALIGCGRIDAGLPGIIEAVRAAGAEVLWVCDPMHGNTETTSSGHKTRRFDNILAELDSAFRIHRARSF